MVLASGGIILLLSFLEPNYFEKHELIQLALDGIMAV